ncbi:MAG: 2-hydroxychromene-2-carboxylate isomerase [Roseibium sp.]
MPTIDYYYAPISGFAYLGEKRLVEIARRAGAEIAFHPVDIAAVFEASETVPPFRQSPARLAYRFHDLKRQADRLGLAINPKPKHWPVPAALPAKLILSADRLGIDPHLVSFAMLEAVYAREMDLSDPDTVAGILEELPVDGEALLAEAKTEAAGERFQAATRAAVGAGVFGSPTYVLGGEMFFGQDRLDMLAWRLGVADPLTDPA